jgi:hypothetical protein
MPEGGAARELAGGDSDQDQGRDELRNKTDGSHDEGSRPEGRCRAEAFKAKLQRDCLVWSWLEGSDLAVAFRHPLPQH